MNIATNVVESKSIWLKKKNLHADLKSINLAQQMLSVEKLMI